MIEKKEHQSSPYLLVFSWQHKMRTQNLKRVFMYNGVISLYCEYNSMTLKSLKFSEI